MDKLIDYVLGNPWFKERDWTDEVKLVSVHDEESTEQFCCGEMKALVEYSNSLFEMAETPEEYDRLILDKDHVDIRKAIAEHQCVSDETRELLEAAKKNPALYAKMREAYGI